MWLTLFHGVLTLNPLVDEGSGVKAPRARFANPMDPSLWLPFDSAVFRSSDRICRGARRAATAKSPKTKDGVMSQFVAHRAALAPRSTTRMKGAPSQLS